jgi:hypothetical protein
MLYRRPENRGFYTSSGIYTDTIRSAANCDSMATVDLTVIPVDTSVTRLGNTWTANQSGATYQWINCWSRAPIPGATAQSFTIPGTFSGAVAVLVSLNGCTEQSVCQPFPISINQIAGAGDIQIYPNPNTGWLTLATERGDLAKVEVFNFLGLRIATCPATASKTRIYLDGAPGVYFLNCISKSGAAFQYKVLRQ